MTLVILRSGTGDIPGRTKGMFTDNLVLLCLNQNDWAFFLRNFDLLVKHCKYILPSRTVIPCRQLLKAQTLNCSSRLNMIGVALFLIVKCVRPSISNWGTSSVNNHSTAYSYYWWPWQQSLTIRWAVIMYVQPILVGELQGGVWPSPHYLHIYRSAWSFTPLT